MLVTGVAPVAGTVMPVIADILTTVAVAGKTAVTVPEFAELVTDVAPATVKKFAGTPTND